MLYLIISEMGVCLPYLKDRFLSAVMDPVLGGGCFEGGEVAAVEDQLGNKLLEMLMQVLIALFDVFEIGKDAVAH